MNYHLTLVTMAVIKKTIIVGENVGEKEPSCTAGMNVNWCSHYEK